MFPPSIETSLLEPWLRAPPRQKPNSDEEHPHLLFHFTTSQLHDDQELSMNLFQNQVMHENPYIGINQSEKNQFEMKAEGKLLDRKLEKKVDPSLRRRNIGVAPRRRVGKKDRHSKISTAQGIRDRRMRLSLQAARKFFDLQDMLGYDKASKTIEWLLTKSKKAIKELAKNHPLVNSNVSTTDAKSESFVSECDEGVSGIEESSNKDVKDVEKEEKNIEKANVRESREKARARARSRTKEKMMIKFKSQQPQSTQTEIRVSNPNPQKLGFSITTTFEAPPPDQEPTYTDQERILSYRPDYEQKPPDSGTLEKLLGIPSSSSSPHQFTSDSFIDPNSNFRGFLTSWDYLSHERAGSGSCTVTDLISPPSNTTMTTIYSSKP